MVSVNFVIALCFLVARAVASDLPPLPVNPGGIGGLFRGPNLETIIKGPDGSQITSEQIGGAVETAARLEPIVVPEIPVPVAATTVPEPIQVTAFDVNVPIVTAAKDTHIIETELVDAPDIEVEQSSDLKGPSGSISVRGSTSIVSGPASTTILQPAKIIPIPIVESRNVSLGAVPPSTLLLPPAPLVHQISIPSGSLAPLNIQTNLLDTSGASTGTQRITDSISLEGTSGAAIVDAAQTVNIAPPAIPTTNQISLSTPESINSEPQVSISSTPNPSDVWLSPQNSPTGIPAPSPLLTETTILQNLLSKSQQLQPSPSPLPANYGIQVQTSTPLAPRTDPQLLTSGIPALSTDGLSGRVEVDQGVTSNQILSSPTNLNTLSILTNLRANQDAVSSTLSPILEQSRNLGPVASVLDTVLVQPTDPNNREVIEFGGKKLENVGNIVPVVNSPILLPTSSISQITLGNDLDVLSLRYVRKTTEK